MIKKEKREQDSLDPTVLPKKRVYSNGECFEGIMILGKYEGPGKYTYKSGEVFEGIFKQSIRVKGRITYPNGDIYKGQFRKDQIHGFGKIY